MDNFGNKYKQKIYEKLRGYEKMWKNEGFSNKMIKKRKTPSKL